MTYLFQRLRIQLNLLRAYLFTCREPVIEELQKRVWPREYLYEHVHLYSVAVSSHPLISGNNTCFFQFTVESHYHPKHYNFKSKKKASLMVEKGVTTT